MNTLLLINVNKLHPQIRPAVTEFANKLVEKLDGNIKAILVYGSAAGAHYNHGVSNINLAVIVKELEFSLLNQSLDLVKWGHKKKIATPLFLSKAYILSSLDIFPIEFKEIKERHQLIFGEDVFTDLDVPLDDLHLLCEQQVKGKLLHLRQAYLNIGANPPVLKKVLLLAFSDLMPVFRQLVFLKGQAVPDQKEELIKALGRVYSLDSGPFLAVYHFQQKKSLISSGLVQAYLQNFLVQLENLSRQLDSL